MPWPIYLALRQLFPTGRRFPFFTIASGSMIATGVMLMHVASSVMGGFGHDIRKMLVDTQGEVQVVARGTIPEPEKMLELIRTVPGVVGATPVAHGVVMIQHRNIPAYPQIQGVDLVSVGQVFNLEHYMVEGSLDDLDDDSVILSLGLARGMGARVGSEIEVYTPLMIDRIKHDEVLLPRVMRVAGLFEIGHQQLDENTVVCTLRTMQELYGIGGSVHVINVHIAPGLDEYEQAGAINRVLPFGMRAQTWFETNADFQSIIQFEKYMIFFLLTFIVLVAAISIMISLFVSVVRKTREIGLLNALGARSRDVAQCFCVQGFILGLFGTAGGLLVGHVVLHFRNDIVRLVARATVGEEVFLKFYQFASLPAHTLAGDVIAIIIGTLIAATLAGLLPAWRAARLKPVEALRHE